MPITGLHRAGAPPPPPAAAWQGQPQGAERSPPRRTQANLDPESLRWALELAVRREDYEEAARLRDALPEAEMAQPTTALEGHVRERVRHAVDVGLGRAAATGRGTAAVAGVAPLASPSSPALGSSAPASAGGCGLAARLEAVRLLQELATPPAASEEAESGLHWILKEGDVDEVVEAAEASLWSAWLPSNDEAVDVMMRQGLKLMSAGELAKALQAFSEVVELVPTFAEGWNKRATALFLAGRFDESISDCHRVLALKPRHFGCLSGLGICHLRMGDESSAIHWLRKALEVNPRSRDMQRIVADLEARSAFARLRPRIKEVLAELKAGRPASVPEGCAAAAASRVRAKWNVCRVEDMEKCTYFFRVSIECLRGPRVAGTARYYALKPAGGSVFPLSRITQGEAGFKLGPGESYRYSFMLTLSEELLAAQGGLLLRCGQEEAFEVCLERIVPSGGGGSGSRGVREAELGPLNEGYVFMGRLEIHAEE